ncbi:MAG: hypothetical protein EAZ58_09600, partial [Flavobacterium sp.]
TNVNCNNDNSQITVSATGGTTNYTYAYAISPSTVPTTAYASNNVVTVDTNNGTVLTWDVYVKDANGCTTKSTVTVVSDVLPAITSVTVPNQCSASGSTFTITATGTGLAPVTYGIAGPTGAFQTSPTFTVAAGTYTVYIKDKNGCVVAAPAPTVVYPRLTAAAVVSKTLDCSASPDAVITTTITGGRSPFTYTVQKGTGTPVSGGPASASLTFTTSVSNANADTYTFVITDANGCTSTTSTTVTAISNPTVAATPTHVTCNGLSNGSVSLVGSGGSGGYFYSKDNVTFVASGVFSGLAASATPYTFYVKDREGCTGTDNVSINQPTALLVSASATAFSCSATNVKQSAVVTIAVPTTGTAPYLYSFNGGAYSSVRTLTVNDNGTDQTINYSVKDAKDCSTAGTAIILNRLNPPTDLAFANAAVTCTAPNTSVTLTATNGVGTLQYETIAPSVVILPKQTSNVFAGLASGSYTFKVTDANGCYYTESYSITPVTPIAIAGNVTSNVDCRGNSTGDATFTVSGNATVGAYTYVLTAGTLGTGSLTKSGNTLTLTDVVAGTYTIRVTDTATGCFADGSVNISQPTTALSISSAVATNVNCNNDNSQITVSATGGTTNYTYAYAISPST